MGNVNMDHLLVTGGAGFIGSNYVRMVLREELAKKVTVLDALTYAGNLENLKEFEGDDRLVFVHGKIQDREAVDTAAKDVDVILNFAAESHNDRAILDPDAAVQAAIIKAATEFEARLADKLAAYHRAMEAADARLIPTGRRIIEEIF
jgi:dTDP-glucose 4,6-dehydratase